MKELSIGEKAKAYDEALKRAKKLGTSEMPLDPKRSVWEQIFPELKESEDEKIRKTIFKALSKKDARNVLLANGVQVSDALSWLEKQGEQKPEEWCFPYNVNETVDKLMAIAECLEMDEDFLYNGYTGTECVKFLRDLARKQVECTPTDEIKPKFKVGDWIVQKNIGVYKVIEICKSWYEVIDFEENHYSISFDNEHMCHLWTIEDANDGDVLYFDNGNIKTIYLFKEQINSSNVATAYFLILEMNNKQMLLFDKAADFNLNTKPATKEQREQLKKAMSNAGYRWNKEELKLEKI